MSIAHSNLPDQWKSHFPATARDAQNFTPSIYHVALDWCVLAVARTRIEGAWGAYIGAVSGKNHEIERGSVLSIGSKLPESIARVIFPIFKGVPYAR